MTEPIAIGNMLHLDDARCADLVLGLLSAPEHARAIAHASTCVPCAERLRAHARAHERARLVPPARSRRRPKAILWFVPMAAAAAALFLLWMTPPRPHALRPSAWLPVPSGDVLWREGQTEDTHLQAGFAAYARHDLALAAREFEAARTSDASEQARRLYLGHVRLEQGRAREALALLRSVDWASLPLAVERDGVALFARALRANDAPAAADSIERALETTPEWVPVRP